MSTYGKKALNNWDYTYSKENALRFNHTSIELQLEILQKWYPIGMKCVKYNIYFKRYEDIKFEVIGYEKLVGEFYNLILNKFISYGGGFVKEKITAHPIHFKPTDEYLKMFLREKKLNNLGI